MDAYKKLNDIDSAACVIHDLLTAQTLLIEALDREIHHTCKGEHENMVFMMKGRASMYSTAFAGMNAVFSRFTDDISSAVSAAYKERSQENAAGGAQNA